ncbi:MAG: hypothetical protein ABI273_22140 [Lacunisphaera sp.]
MVITFTDDDAVSANHAFPLAIARRARAVPGGAALVSPGATAAIALLNRGRIHAMSVIPLTLFFSLLLAGLFIGLFVWEHRRRRFGGLERDSLLPLADEGTQAAGSGDQSFPAPESASRGTQVGVARAENVRSSVPPLS